MDVIESLLRVWIGLAVLLGPLVVLGAVVVGAVVVAAGRSKGAQQ